jgi:hypothetical protein
VAGVRTGKLRKQEDSRPATARDIDPILTSPDARPIAIRVESLAPDAYAPLFALSEAELMARGMRRTIAPDNPGIGYPCRVSLEFARAGEELLLVNHRHLDRSTTPYRAEGPVFIRRDAVKARHDVYPEIILQREMAVRAYDHAGIMAEADLAAKGDLIALTETWLARPDVAHVDFHSARRGCFFCRIRRV